MFGMLNRAQAIISPEVFCMVVIPRNHVAELFEQAYRPSEKTKRNVWLLMGTADTKMLMLIFMPTRPGSPASISNGEVQQYVAGRVRAGTSPARPPYRTKAPEQVF